MKKKLFATILTAAIGVLFMVIRMPVMCGMSTHSTLYSKIDKAIEDKDFPIDLDCAETVFTTSMFCRFVIIVKKKVELAGGRVRLINVNGTMYEGLRVVNMDRIVELVRRFDV